MAKARWKTFGHDMAMVNAHILKTTGHWGKLKSTDQVWDYMEDYMGGQTNLLKPPKPAANEPALERRHGLVAMRLVALKDKTLYTYTVEPDGSTKAMESEKPIDKDGQGKTYRCNDCKAQFPDWPKAVDHIMGNKPLDQPEIVI